MKDRLHRTTIKKTNRSFKFISLFVGTVSILTTIVLTVYLVNTNLSNNKLATNINKYNNAYNVEEKDEIPYLQINNK